MNFLLRMILAEVNESLWSSKSGAPYRFPEAITVISQTVKGRTNLKIKEKYLSPHSFEASGCRGSKGMTVSRSNSSLSLYSSASAPSSPLSRKVRFILSSVKTFSLMV